MIKRFLISVMVLAALDVTASASVMTYCTGGTPSGSNPTCNPSASFTNAVVPIDFSSAAVVGNSFTDPVSGTAFFDYSGGSITDPGNELTDSKGGFQINLPANTLVFSLQFLSTAGYAVQFTSGGSNFIYAFGSSSSGTVFAVTSSSAITNLDVYANTFSTPASIQAFDLQGSGGTGAQTPEVGSLLLIGTGLILMRWRPRKVLRTRPVERILAQSAPQTA